MYKKKSIGVIKNILRGLSHEPSLATVCKAVGIHPYTLTRWCNKNDKLAEAVKRAKISALENSLQLCAVGGFRVKVKTKYRADGEIAEQEEIFAPPNVAALIFSLTNLHSEKWKNNRDHFFGDRDRDIAASEYEILTKEENDEARELLKEFVDPDTPGK